MTDITVKVNKVENDTAIDFYLVTFNEVTDCICMTVNSYKEAITLTKLYINQRFIRFVELVNQLNQEFTSNIKVKSVSSHCVRIELDNVYKWINIYSSEDYVRNQLLDLLVDDVDEYLLIEAKPITNEELTMLLDAGLDPFMFDFV